MNTETTVAQKSNAERKSIRAERLKLLRRNKAFLVGAFILGFWLLIAVFGSFIAPYAYDAMDFAAVSKKPSGTYWLGTNKLGQDVFSRILAGTQLIVWMSFTATALGTIVGGSLGLAAGYFKGWFDIILMRLLEAISAIPVLIVALLVAFSQISYVFWMGFPPFLWTCCIILAIVKLITNQSNQSYRVMLGGVGLTLVNYSYPLLSPVLVLIILLELAKMSRADFVYCWTKRYVVGAAGLTIIVLNVAVVLKSLNVRHYVDDDGGIQPIEIRNVLAIFIVILILIGISRYSLKTLPLIVIAFFASTMNFAALALLSQRDLGYVSYYPAKAGYLVLILGFASIGSMLNGVQRFKNYNVKKFSQAITMVLAFSVIWFSVNATSNPKYAKYGFVSTNMVWDEIRLNPGNPGRDCFLHAMDVTSDLNSNSDNRTILFLQDDLQTRWINGVRGRLIDATYSLSIPIGQAKQSLAEILEWWTIQFPDAHVLILAPEQPLGLEKWANKIEYRKFACV